MSEEKDMQGILQSIIKVELYGKHKDEKKAPTIPVVTVSRYCGANGSETAALLAEKLGVQLYDQNLLDTITKEVKTDKYLLERLDEKATGPIDDFIHSVFTKHGASKDDFYRGMIKVILDSSRNGGVIVGRAAHLLTTSNRMFRLRLEGSLPVCTERVAKRMNVKKSKARKFILKTNEERVKFVKKVFDRYTSDTAYYDMVINTDMYTPEQLVNLVIMTMSEAGFRVTPPKIKG
ncbi:MAG: cytidylate kinase-like family protein [Magnetococcales bacterium]|nr:cytidylate kinase-like family protein [Magnetococcales bacterium]